MQSKARIFSNKQTLYLNLSIGIAFHAKLHIFMIIHLVQVHIFMNHLCKEIWDQMKKASFFQGIGPNPLFAARDSQHFMQNHLCQWKVSYIYVISCIFKRTSISCLKQHSHHIVSHFILVTGVYKHFMPKTAFHA
jgi:hypothetical protein